jgi:hypothetical protein
VSLSGTLGVEKTLTTKAISKHLQRSLYSIDIFALNLPRSCLTLQISARELSLDLAMMEV